MRYFWNSQHAEQTSVPSTPSTGRRKLFPWSDGWRSIDAAAVVTKLLGARFVQTATVTVASTASITTLLGAGVGSLTLSANELAVGTRVVLEASGFLSDTGALPTITFTFRYGSTDLCVTAAIVTTGTDSNIGWHARAEFIVRTIGATGTVFAQGYVSLIGNAGVLFPMVKTATVTIDTTAATALNFLVTWSASAAGNTCSCTNASVTL